MRTRRAPSPLLMLLDVPSEWAESCPPDPRHSPRPQDLRVWLCVQEGDGEVTGRPGAKGPQRGTRTQAQPVRTQGEAEEPWGEPGERTGCVA